MTSGDGKWSSYTVGRDGLTKDGEIGKAWLGDMTDEHAGVVWLGSLNEIEKVRRVALLSKR